MNRILSLAALMLMAATPQQQTFKANVELVAVEATVVDNKNAPVQGLAPGDFDVTISGHARRVVTAEWLTYGTERIAQPSAAASAAAPAADAGAAPATAPPARKYIVAIDEESFQPAAVLAAKTAAERFIDRLRPDDYVGVYAYPTGKANMALSQDHAAVKKVLASVNAVRHEPISRFHMTVGEIVDIANGDAKALGAVVHRECGGDPMDDSPVSLNATGCPREAVTEANGLAGYLEIQVARSVEGLRGLIKGLAGVPGRKILVLVSGGLYSSDRVVGRRVSSGSTIHTLTHDAAAANLELYVLHLDWSFLESFAEQNVQAASYYRNSDVAEAGLDILASDLGGDVTRVRGTNPDFAFNQVLTKTSAYYLLGVEPADQDRDGKPHPIKVKVKRRGVEVLSRTEVTIPAK